MNSLTHLDSTFLRGARSEASSSCRQDGPASGRGFMAGSSCIDRVLGMCMESAHSSASAPVFGVAEFLTAVAIFAAAYSMADERYKFRLTVARIPLPQCFFWATVIVGVSLVIVSFWFELSLPIPSAINNPRYFEAAFALVFVVLLAVWIYVAFVKPPLFSRRNASRFGSQMFHNIIDGSEPELAAAVYEFGRSVPVIIGHARTTKVERDLQNGGFKQSVPEASAIANELLLLAGDRRFCRVVARRFPWVASELFRSAATPDLEKLPLAQFSKNIASELFADETTAIHHEDDGFRTGLIGYLKPVSTSLFGDARLVEALAGQAGSPLDPLWLGTENWGPRNWRTYQKAVNLYLSDRLDRFGLMPTTALYQICHGFRHACIDLYKVNEMAEGHYQSIEFEKLRISTEFVADAIALIKEKNLSAPRRAKFKDRHVVHKDVFDILADVALHLIIEAGAVNTPDFRSWEVQHNTVWTAFTVGDHDDSEPFRVFRKRLTQLIWNEITDMERLPNYQRARVIAVCLNTMGLRIDSKAHRPPETRALKRALLRWMRRNFLSIFEQYPDVARSCVGGSITFNEQTRQIVKTYQRSLGREPHREIFDLVVNDGP